MVSWLARSRSLATGFRMQRRSLVVVLLLAAAITGRAQEHKIPRQQKESQTVGALINK